MTEPAATHEAAQAATSLRLRRETLRTLTSDELLLVAGGRPTRNNCTERLSGCIS